MKALYLSAPNQPFFGGDKRNPTSSLEPTLPGERGMVTGYTSRTYNLRLGVELVEIYVVPNLAKMPPVGLTPNINF